MGHFFWVSFGQFKILKKLLALPGSASLFGVSQGSPMCACASLSQDGFQGRGLLVAGITYYGAVPPPFVTSQELSGPEGLLDFKNEKYVVSYLLSGQGPASSLDCPVLILEYWSTGNESPIALPWRGAHLPAAAVLLTIVPRLYMRPPRTCESYKWTFVPFDRQTGPHFPHP